LSLRAFSGQERTSIIHLPALKVPSREFKESANSSDFTKKLLCAIAQYKKCVTARNRGGSKCGGQVSVGEEAEAVGLGLGRVEGLSAICPRGRDQDGCSAREEDSAEGSGGGATRTFAHASHGFLDGGGLIQVPTNSPATDMAIKDTGTLATNIHTRLTRSTPT
jgi:hypothetical protein